MCGRYRFDDGRDSIELKDIIAAVNRRVVVEPIGPSGQAAPDGPSGEVFPGDVATVVASGRDMQPALFDMRWGYALSDGRRVINARSETAAQKPMFRDGMRNRRCAVPATRYFEWERAGRARTKYAVWPSQRAMFCMAGIYRIEDGKPVFTILTREPAESIAFIHDRMPVILPPDLATDWTNPRYSAEEMLAHAVLDVSFAREEAAEQLTMDMLFE